jgi:PAS domain S-box-containing protein
MKPHLTITARLALVFALFAAALLAAVGVLAYHNGRLALEASIAADLRAIAHEKQAAFEEWVREQSADVATIATNPDIVRHLAAHRMGESPALTAEHADVLGHLQHWVGADQSLLALLILDPETGQVIAATDPQEEGRFREDRPYFIYGRQGPYVQNPYYAFAGRAMEAAAPVRASDGRLVGVLVGRLNLAEVDAIIGRGTAGYTTEDAYLVNSANLFVTQPRFIADPAALQRGVRTAPVERCLAGESGVIQAGDYRGAATIAAYLWLPERRLCLVVTRGLAEALAPTRAFGLTLAQMSLLALLAAVALAIGLARSITGPVRQLMRGAAEIGQGNLAHRIQVSGRDEIGQLAGAFNAMAASLHHSLGETARGHRLMFALSEAAQAVQRARTPEEIYRVVGDEVDRLGYHASVFALDKSQMYMVISYLTWRSGLLEIAEKLTGLSAQGYQYPLMPGGFFHRIIVEGKTVFCEPAADSFAEAMPKPTRPLAGQLAAILGIRQAIYAPLTVSGERIGLLTVTGADLTEADVPAMTTFANQIAIALENARLYQEAHQRAEALRESEERFRQMAENIQEVFWISPPDVSQMLYLSPAFEKVWGRPRASVYENPLSWVEAIHLDDRDHVLAALAEHAQGKYDVEYRIVCPDDAVRWIHDRGFPVRDAAGQITRMVGIAEDITGRKEAEQALQRRMNE